MLKAGDVVRLEEGGPNMMVLVVNRYENKIVAQCRWLKNGIFISELYQLARLILVAPCP
jgi:uncharacterized protein YodC (DUF2158 family)